MPVTLDQICWGTSLDSAEHRAAARGRAVLIDFSAAPFCQGCLAMERVTYADPRVAESIVSQFAPVRMAVREKPAVATEYLVNWTPHIVIADSRGRVHHRIEGFLPPEDFLAQIRLGNGKYLLNMHQFAEASDRLETVVDFHSGTETAAQSLYWLGVARYQETRDAAELLKTWQQLADEYPESHWAERTRIPRFPDDGE